MALIMLPASFNEDGHIRMAKNAQADSDTGSDPTVLSSLLKRALTTDPLGIESVCSEPGNSERLFFESLGHGGISTWWEDWSAVGEFVYTLQESGLNVEEHLAAHPDKYQKLHKQVMIIDVDEVAVTLMGVQEKSQLLGPIATILPHTMFSFPRWISVISRGESFYRGQNAIRRPDGTLCECLVVAALPKTLAGLSNFPVYVFDIGDFKGGPSPSVQSTIERASRVSAMGALTASIAHEVKSPLAAIATNAAACLRWLRLPNPNLAEAEEAIRRLVNDASRAKDVVDRTLSFLKHSPAKAIELSIVDIIRDSILLVMRDIQRHDVKIDFAPDGNIPAVFADPIQVQQVLTNLLLNAIHAMEEIDRQPRITIDVCQDGSNIRIEVTDIGTGIAPEQLGRLFEPFYSTKDNGIGMGLAASRACVEANGGRIWAESEFGKGASFFFTLNCHGKHDW